MVNKVKRFMTDDDAAVTVDWVVLTAAIVGLGIVVLQPIATGTTSMSNSVGGYINNVPVGY